MKTYVKKPEYVQAVQWNGEDKLTGISFEKFVPSGSFHDRFNDIPDGPWVIINGKQDHKRQINKGDYLIVQPNGLYDVLPPHVFENLYNVHEN